MTGSPRDWIPQLLTQSLTAFRFARSDAAGNREKSKLHRLYRPPLRLKPLPQGKYQVLDGHGRDTPEAGRLPTCGRHRFMLNRGLSLAGSRRATEV